MANKLVNFAKEWRFYKEDMLPTNKAIPYSFTNYLYSNFPIFPYLNQDLLNAFTFRVTINFLITFHFLLYLVNESLLRQDWIHIHGIE